MRLNALHRVSQPPERSASTPSAASTLYGYLLDTRAHAAQAAEPKPHIAACPAPPPTRAPNCSCRILSPGASIYVQLQWTLLNSFVALTGYYFAAFTIDRTWWGRRRMQAFGFFMLSLLFLLCATLYDTLVADAIHW